MVASPRILVASLLIAAAGCSSPAPPEPVSVEEMQSATYTGIYEDPVTLVDGEYEGEPSAPGSPARPTVRRIDELAVLGDLDGDGIDDAAVLLVENSGGSGSFVYLAALTAQPGGAVNSGTVHLGDRVQVVAMSVEAGEIVIDLVTPGPDDALASPSVKARVRYRLEGEALVEAERENTGRLSTADLEGPIWLLLELGAGRPVAGGVSITARFANGRLTGSSGCNNYFASYVGDSPGELQIGPAGSTRRACPEPAMTEETDFQARLGVVVRYGYAFGRLRLDYVRDGSLDTLVFEPHDEADAAP